jgi:site-specific DNA-adenine methylase
MVSRNPERTHSQNQHSENKNSLFRNRRIDLVRKAWSEKTKGHTAYFIDPPYCKAGKRLYEHGEIDHRKLFEIAARLRGRVLMTYDDSAEIRTLAKEFNFN